MRELAWQADADNARSRRGGNSVPHMFSRGALSLRSEALDIPESLRVEAYLRDAATCRVCGKWLGERAGLHHIRYGGDYTGMGGRRKHSLDNVVVVCWLPGDPANGVMSCHQRVHSEKDCWIPLLEAVIATPGVTAFQLRRWRQRERSAARSLGSSTA